MKSLTRPRFVPFNEHKAVRLYRRNLPHWRQKGATYFVTFRLADSVPTAVLRQWDYEKTKWLGARGINTDIHSNSFRLAFERLPANEQYLYHKHFSRLMHQHLDGGQGGCSLRKDECIETVRAELERGDGQEHHLGDFVIMPNHVHVLVTPIDDTDLEMILKSVKGASAVKCNRACQSSGTFWQADSYDHIVRSPEQLGHLREYIADNPQKAGITLNSLAIHRSDWMDQWGDF